MTWSVNVHTTTTTDTEPSIIATFDNAKYIFGTSENTGRAFLQNNGNWKRSRALFFSQTRVEKMSGLPGLVMSFADATIRKLHLLGPPGLTHMIASMRMYIFRDSIQIQTSEIPWTTPAGSSSSPCYQDENITVYAIPVLPSLATHSPSRSSEPSAPANSPIEPTQELPEKRKREPSPEGPRKRQNPGSRSPARIALSDGLLELIQQKGFTPETLTGDLEDEYRRMIIHTMFPNLKPNLLPTKEETAENRRRSRQGMKKEATPPLAENENIDIDSQRRTRGSLPNGFQKQLPRFVAPLPPSTSPPTLSYFVVGPRYRGKFDVEKARELGIVGPDRGKLTRGESITIRVKAGVSDELVERVVRPEEVMGESTPPSAFLILDIPTIDLIPSLINSFKTTELYHSVWSEDPAAWKPSSDRLLRTIFHQCGKGVLEDERYKTFMRGFGSEVYHMVASREHCPDPVTFTSAAYNQLRLSRLDEKMFPTPQYSLTGKKDLSTIPGLPTRIQPMTPNLQHRYHPLSPPAMGQTALEADRFHPPATGARPIEFSENMQRAVTAAKENVERRLKKIEEGDVLKEVPGKDVSIVTLGTGGSLPSKYRNVLSTFIRIPGWGNVLLDVGEGTWGQLTRNYGLDGTPYTAWDAIRDLKCIFVSHIHGDHHIGLAHLLAKRRLLDPAPAHPLYLVSIRNVHIYLREMSDVHDLGLTDPFNPSSNGVIPILSETLHYRSVGKYLTTGMWQVGGDEPWLDFQTSVQNGQEMCRSLGLEWFKTADVHHRARCFGMSFKHQDGWGITFSGDTMPTENLVRIGADTTVLIHESTMADFDAEMAIKKGHSTMGQAIEIGKRMNAKNILLTHFSARYPKLPPSLSNQVAREGPDAKNLIVFGFDHLNLTLGEMWKMAYYTPAIYCNINDTLEEDVESLPGTPTHAARPRAS
ncbi:unnamed protein product [Cyclocybe aegerita]|uniref:ribonuclease Z n=1 Tax=Cyclocybe aegerita TaxID=1973307 RepID=A0A8S0VTX4_CYCAE|nr:unnamed protein product [Cyclocybe aegerita]